MSDQERKDFEAWVKKELGSPWPVALDRADNGDYLYLPAMQAWEVWQARAALAQQAVPMTHQQQTKAALWDLAVEKGLVTVHSEQLAPGTWSAHLSVASWIEGHEKACDISNEAAMLAAAPAAPQAEHLAEQGE